MRALNSYIWSVVTILAGVFATAASIIVIAQLLFHPYAPRTVFEFAQATLFALMAIIATLVEVPLAGIAVVVIAFTLLFVHFTR